MAKNEPVSVRDNSTKEKSSQLKSRIDSWIKDAEADAQHAERYLDKKREKKKEKGWLEIKKKYINLSIFYNKYQQIHYKRQQWPFGKSTRGQGHRCGSNCGQD